MTIAFKKTDVYANQPPSGSSGKYTHQGCVNCGEKAAISPSDGSPFCDRCLFTWAFAPSTPVAAVAGVESRNVTSDSRMLGQYMLLEEIGRGGMGVINRAIHCETNEMVAVKTIFTEHEGCAETLARFRREMESAQSLDHPHLMPILEVGASEQGVPFFSMPLALGGSLHHLNAKYRGRWRQTAELLVKIAQAVHHAHLRGILHRDIKPGNILFTEDYEPLLTDFGLARPLKGSNDLTRSCAVLGTPNYVAPEQAAGVTSELTAAADIYSLGAVMFELLTGRPPFVGNNPLQVLQQVSKQSPIRPRRLSPEVPKALEAVCMRCLEHSPSDRYASAQQLADDLELWLDGRPLASRPARFHLRKFAKRHPTVSVWCGCMGALAAVLWFAWRTAGHPVASTNPSTSVAVVVDDMGQGASVRLVVQQLTGELRRDLSASRTFCSQNDPRDHFDPEAAALNPLAYGRAVNAQTVLACCVRQVGDQTHLVAQFLRCDTGKVIWQRAKTISQARVSTELPSATNELIEDLLINWNTSRDKTVEMKHSSPLPDAKTFYIRAMELTKHGNRRDMDAAITLFRRASEMDPQYVDARAMLAYALWIGACYFDEVEQYDSAIRTAKETLVLDSDCAQAHRVIASCYMTNSRYDEALEEFGRAVELNPRSAGCYLSFGVCLRRMGHPDKAIPWLKRAVHLEPAYGTFHASLAEAFILCGLDDQAEASMQRAAELEQDTPDSQFAMVTLRIWQKRFEEARRLCTQARTRFPSYQFGLNFAAWVEFCDSNLLLAKPYFETLHAEDSYQKRWIFHGAINPASALAYIAQQSGSLELARTLVEEASQTDLKLLVTYPNNSRILHDLAATYAIAGDNQNAFRYLEKALAAGWAEHLSTQIDPRFTTVSSLPPFKRLLDSTKPTYHGDGL